MAEVKLGDSGPARHELDPAHVNKAPTLISEIGRVLHTQDNACTSHPMFLVQEERRAYGMTSDYTEHFTWVNGDGDEVSRGEPGARKVWYRTHWEFVSAFFTRDAAEQFIARQGHNYGKLRVWVASGHNNPEWKKVRAHLMGELNG